MLGVAPVASVRYYHRSEGPKPFDYRSCVVEPTHMRIAGGETAIRVWVAWILLEREKQSQHRVVKAPAEEMRGAYLHK
jgi:hypothetical protein